MDGKQQDQSAPSISAWASLLGLLSPSEYFITVDHSVLWQRHVAWAKPEGAELRTYVTQRFASNMIVLSLMLGAEISVFFNSSAETSEMRRLMEAGTYRDLKFWIGTFIALDACVTIMALVATFTLWGMIGSISDTNAHALLRSSIGQYVTSMPPRFVVAALYLFILWLFLAFMDLTSGPWRISFAAVILFLFFQVIIPLSAFGRLIIHTGAMAKRRVLDEEFEKELLPSGLHASLLIRATGQRRKYASAILQYRKKVKPSHRNSSSSLIVADNGSSRSAFTVDNPPNAGGQSPSAVYKRSSDGSVSSDAPSDSGFYHTRQSSYSSINTANSFFGGQQARPMDGSGSVQSLPAEESPLFSAGTPLRRSPAGFSSSPWSTKRRHMRSESGDVSFPRASVLNTVGAAELREVVKQALAENEAVSEEEHLLEVIPEISEGAVPPPPLEAPPPTTKDDETTELGNLRRNRGTPTNRHRRFPRPSPRPSHRRIGSLTSQPTANSSEKLVSEWVEEASVRNLYADAPPPHIFMPTTVEEEEGQDTVPSSREESPTKPTHRPRPSLLNRDWGLQAFADLIKGESIDTPESSIADEENNEREVLDGGNNGDEEGKDHEGPMGGLDRKKWSRSTDDRESGEGQRLLNRNELGGNTKGTSRYYGK